MKNIIETIRKMGRYSKFLKLIDIAGHTDSLRNCSSFTMLVPTDDAMTSLEEEYPMRKEYRQKFLEVLKNHVIKGKCDYECLTDFGGNQTMDGRKLKYDTQKKLINGKVGIVSKNWNCKNGLVHGVDGVMM